MGKHESGETAKPKPKLTRRVPNEANNNEKAEGNKIIRIVNKDRREGR